MSEHDEIFGIDRKKALISGAIALLLLAVIVGAIGEVASYHKVLKALESGEHLWLPVCLVGELLAYAGYIVAYRDIARVDGGPCFRLWTSTRIVAIGFGAFLAGSSAGTLSLDYWALHRAGEKPHMAVRRVLALNTIEWAVLGSFATISAVALLVGAPGEAPLAMELAWLVVVPACILAALWVSSPERAERLEALPRDHPPLERDPRTWPAWAWHAGRAGFADAVGGVVIVRHLLRQPRRHLGAVVGFPLYWIGDILTLYAALRAFDQHPAPAALVLGYTTAYVVTALPLPAGGVGGIEAGLAFSLTLVGIPLAPALLGTLVYRVFTLWLPIAPALLALPQAKVLNDELPGVPHAESR